jgi:predicted aspartyl protease
VPILHFQLNGQAQDASGQLRQIAPTRVMRDKGPCVPGVIKVAQSIADALMQAGTPVPAPISGMVLIDTGASNSCIDDGIAQRLQLPVIDVVNMTSASHASTQRNVYPVQIELASGLTVNVPRAIGAELASQDLVGLIGRDFLQRCTLFYNGITGEITLSI